MRGLPICVPGTNGGRHSGPIEAATGWFELALQETSPRLTLREGGPEGPGYGLPRRWPGGPLLCEGRRESVCKTEAGGLRPRGVVRRRGGSGTARSASLRGAPTSG